MNILFETRALMNYKNTTKTASLTKKSSAQDKMKELLKESSNELLNESLESDDKEKFVEEQAVSVDFSGITEEDRINSRIGMICEKMKSGIKLSEKEMEFLKEHSPGAYKMAVQVKKEREDFDEQMKRCKTKEQVSALMSKKDSTFMSNLKEAISVNNRSEAIKLTTIHNNLKDEYKLFKQTNDYAIKPEKSEDKENIDDIKNNNKEEIDLNEVMQLSAEEVEDAEEILK